MVVPMVVPLVPSPPRRLVPTAGVPPKMMLCVPCKKREKGRKYHSLWLILHVFFYIDLGLLTEGKG